MRVEHEMSRVGRARVRSVEATLGRGNGVPKNTVILAPEARIHAQGGSLAMRMPEKEWVHLNGPSPVLLLATGSSGQARG